MNRLLLLLSSTRCSAFIAAPGPLLHTASSRGPLHAAALAKDLDLKSWCEAAGIAADKFDVDSATVTQDVAALEVLARVPRSLTLSAARRKDWPGKLTAAAIEAVEEGGDLGSYVRSWRGGGWATSSDDLEARDKETVDSLLATGSDNDFEIFKKFGMKCHPAVDRAAYRLSALCRHRNEKAARAALVERGYAWRECREALIPMVRNPTRSEGTARRRRELDAAELYSRALARAARVGDDIVVCPLYDTLRDGAAGATATLVEDPGGDDLLVVASRALVAGDAVTRDYGRAPSLGFIDGSDADPASESEVLRRLLQFGIDPQWSS